LDTVHQVDDFKVLNVRALHCAL